MSRSKWVCVVCSVVFVLFTMVGMTSVIGCSQPTQPQTQEQPQPAQTEKVFNLTIATQHPMEAAMNNVVNTMYAKWLDEQSNGRIKLTIIPSSQAAQAADLFDAARTGIVDIACQQYNEAQGRFPLNEITSLPHLFKWPDATAVALTGDALIQKYPEFRDEFAGTRYLLVHTTPSGQVCTVKKPVHTVEDMQGLLIRSTGYYITPALKELGATPVQLALTEVFDSVAKGVIDGEIGCIEGFWVFGYKDLYNYVTMADFSPCPFVHVMNQDTYDSLPPDLQALFSHENNVKLMKMFGHQINEDEQKYKKLASEIFQDRGYDAVYDLPPEEYERFAAAMAPTWDLWVERAASKVGEAKAKAMLEDCKKFAEQFAYKGFDQETEDLMRKWGAPGHE